MDGAGREQGAITVGEHAGHGAAGRHPGDVDPRVIDLVSLHYSAYDPGDHSSFSGSTQDCGFEPVPAAERIRTPALLGIQHDEVMSIRELIHARACCKDQCVLLAAMEHHE